MAWEESDLSRIPKTARKTVLAINGPLLNSRPSFLSADEPQEGSSLRHTRSRVECNVTRVCVLIDNRSCVVRRMWSVQVVNGHRFQLDYADWVVYLLSMRSTGNREQRAARELNYANRSLRSRFSTSNPSWFAIRLSRPFLTEYAGGGGFEPPTIWSGTRRSVR